MRTNYVLIDYENVQPKDIADLDREEFRVKVFLGSKQTKIDVSLAKVMQAMGDRAEYIQIEGNGANALDFHVCYYIGRIAGTDANSYFHIVSKDTGFDPLIAHLKCKKILASRVSNIREIPLLRLNGSMGGKERLEAVVADLKRRGHSKPRKVATLTSTIVSLFQKTISEQEATAIVKNLERDRHISVDGTNVSYNLS